MPMQGGFDASQFAPKQIADGHPPGKKFPAQIVGTSIEPTKAGDGGMFIVMCQTPAGEIPIRYNLWNTSQKAVEIANGQMSALCHATGVFRVNWQDDGASLRGARLQIDVDYQPGQEPTPEKPNGGWTHVTKVYDANGNEPGKAPAQTQPQAQGWTAQPPQQQQPAPAHQAPLQQGNGGWNTTTSAAPSANPAPGGWNQQPAGPAPTEAPKAPWSK